MVRLSLIAGERCDHCNEITNEVVYVFKTRSPEQGRMQLWLHNTCLRKLTEKLWMMDAKRKREANQ